MATKSSMRSYARLGKLGDDDDKIAEYAHWDALGDTERFRVAWDLVVQAFLIQGKSLDELRFQRSVTRLERRQDLINAKLAAGRPQDLVDAGSLAKGKR